MVTLTVGKDHEMAGYNGDRPRSPKPMHLPQGIYFEKISSQGRIAVGIDQNGHVWQWGYSPGGSVERVEMRQDYEKYSRPCKVKWFAEKGMKVLQARAVYTEYMLKVQEKDGNINFYVVTDAVDHSHAMKWGGRENYEKVFGNYIGKLKSPTINPKKIVDFDLSRWAGFIITEGDKRNVKSIIPDQPDAKGLIHFYKEPNNNEWRFMTEAEYKVNKQELPLLSFATRHPIEDFKEK